MTRRDARHDVCRPAHRPRASRGVTLVDVLAGLVVALIAVAVVYQTLVIVQATRRNAAAVADLHANGSLALSILASRIGNAGAGLAAVARWLDTCPAVADIATTMRPVHVLISDGGGADRSDSIVIRQSLAAAGSVPLAFAADAPPGANFRIDAVDGIATGDRIVAIGRNGACATTVVTGVTGAAGILDVAHTAIAVALPITSVLLDLGPAGRGFATRFDVVANTLRTADVVNGDAPNPLLSNVVVVKLRYGVDNDGDGTVDTWVGAAAGSGWDPATLLAAPRATLERIRAVRIGVIVRSEQPDRGRREAFPWVLFDCEADDKALCPGRVSGTIAATTSGAYRYRTFETIVPLRNVVWNAGA